MKYLFYLFFIITLSFACKSTTENKGIKAELRDISEYVYASVEVVSEDYSQSKTSKTGIIKEISVSKGDIVNKGQILFTIAPTSELKNRLSDALISLNEAQNNLLGIDGKLMNIEIDIKKTIEKVQLDSLNYQRKLRLWNKGIGSKNDLEQTLLNYKNSMSLLESQKLNYKQTKTTLTSNYKLAQNRLSTEKDILKDYHIRSEQDGIIYNIYKEKGELITPQDKFAEIGSDKNYEIKMNIDEVDISKIDIGDTAIIQLEAYSDEVYKALINYITEVKDAATQTFEVEASFLTSPKKLYSGLSGEANILVGKRNDALIIPSEYLIDRTNLLTPDGLITIKTGVKNLEYVEILEGIDSSTVIYKSENK